MATDISAVRRQIGAGLRRVAGELRISQLELARRMKVSGPTVNMWMSGESRFPLERLPELCAALHVGTDLMLYEMGLTDREPRVSLEAVAAQRVRDSRLHFTATAGLHTQAAASGVSGNQGEDGGHTSYLVAQTA